MTKYKIIYQDLTSEIQNLTEYQADNLKDVQFVKSVEKVENE